MIQPKKKYIRGSSAVPRVFWAHWYMYRDGDFNKSIGEHTVSQADRQKLWLYLAAF